MIEVLLMVSKPTILYTCKDACIAIEMDAKSLPSTLLLEAALRCVPPPPAAAVCPLAPPWPFFLLAV